MADQGPSDAHAQATSSADPELLPVREWNSAIDADLQGLVAFANRVEFELSIRVFVSGGVLSGSLIGMGSYFERLATLLSPEEEPLETAESIKDILAGLYRDVSTRYRASEEARNEIDATDIRHIHLDDAWLHIPGAEPLVVGLWRGRLAEIAGWSIGGYEAASETRR